MTTVASKDLYEWPMRNDTATCEDCGVDIKVPNPDDPDGDFKAPHWRRQEHWEPFDDVYEALCDDCYAAEVSEILELGD